jgi:hypothetical protein
MGIRAEDADAQMAVFLAGARTLSAKRGESLQQWFDRVNPVLRVSDKVIEGGNVFEQAAYHGTPHVSESQLSEAASRYLNSIGIPGLKYPEGGRSRRTGEGKHNFVIFDDSLVKVTKKFYQDEVKGPRGAIEFANAETVIHLFKTANYSTLLHETSHLFTNEMKSLIDQGLADEATIKNYNTLLNFADGKLDREGHEKIARAMEAYVREGKAPSVALTNAFQKFRAWLTAIYRSIKNLNVEVPQDVKDVFDRILASEKEIEEAKRYYEGRKSLVDMIQVTKAQKEKLEKTGEKAKASALDLQVKRYMSAYFSAIGGRKAIAEHAQREVENLPVYMVINHAQLKGGIDYQSVDDFMGAGMSEAVKEKHKNVISKGGYVTERPRRARRK